MRLEFIDNYQAAMGYICNYTRSYVTTQVGKEIDKYMDAHDNKLPKSALAYSVLQRTIDCTAPENKQFIVWWFDKILPKMTSGTFNYAPEKRYYATISDCKIHYNDSLYEELPSSTEAFAVLLFENTRSRWLMKRRLSQQLPPGKKKMVIKERKKPDEKRPPADTQVYYVSEHPKLGTKWSLPSSGQNIAGGWSEEGLNKFADLRTVNEQVRGTANGKAKEREILNVLREAMSITENSAEAQALKDGRVTQKKGGRSRNRASVSGIAGAVDLTREVTLQVPEEEDD